MDNSEIIDVDICIVYCFLEFPHCPSGLTMYFRRRYHRITYRAESLLTIPCFSSLQYSHKTLNCDWAKPEICTLIGGNTKPSGRSLKLVRCIAHC